MSVSRLPVLLCSLLCSAGLGFAAAKKPLHATYQPNIASVSNDSITVNTGRVAGYKVTAADPDQAGPGSGPANVKTYKVGPFTAITVNGSRSDASALKAGMLVHIVAGLDPNVAASINASDAAPQAEATPAPKKPAGNIKGGTKMKKAFKAIISNRVVSVSANSIVIGRPGGRINSAYQIHQLTTIKVNNERADVSVIKPGMKVDVTAGTDPTVAARITAEDDK